MPAVYGMRSGLYTCGIQDDQPEGRWGSKQAGEGGSVADIDPQQRRSGLRAMQSEERVALLALLLSGRTKWAKVVQDILDAGSVWTVLEKAFGSGDALFDIEKSPLTGAMTEARALLDWCISHGVGVHAFWEEHYPASLREIHEMPPVVFTKGTVTNDRRAIAVVGSRRASPRAREIASNIATVLSERDVTVVSGLAAGIDTAAHTAALRAGGRTVAVIGTGINHYYPRENQKLQDEIADRGMVLSQFLPDMPPTRKNFPMRNAVMSGYAAATVVVEAGEHSGARIQTRYALNHGRPVIFTRELLANQWARDYSKRPGVYVASGIEELLEIVDGILTESTMTADEFVAALEASELGW